MYCQKCGKKIENNSKFCPYCGYVIKTGQSHISHDAAQKENKKARTKKWVIPVVIAAGIAVAGIAVFLGVKVMQKPDEISGQETVEKQEEVSEPVETQQSEYPKEITLDEETQNGLREFIQLLGNTDCKMCGGDGQTLGENRIMQTHGTTYFGYSFLYMSLYNQIPFIDGQVAEMVSEGPYYWQIPTENVENYLKSSIDTVDYQMQFSTQFPPYKIEDGKVCFTAFDPNSMWTVETPVIDNIMAVADSTIEIEGSICYTYSTGGEDVNAFDIILKVNQDSMWGGYTLKEIKNWGQNVSNSDEDSNRDGELDTETKEELIRLLYILANIDYKGSNGGIMSLSQAELGDLFLYFSLECAEEVMRGTVTDPTLGKWELTRGEVQEYLMNSLGFSEFAGAYILSDSGNLLSVGRGNPPAALSIEDMEIKNIDYISETEIQLQGEMIYKNLPERTEKAVKCQITMVANPKSVWGGYTLKSIDSWGESGDYILTDIATRYYSEAELDSIDKYTLYLARNELYARHGYIFTVKPNLPSSQKSANCPYQAF